MACVRVFQVGEVRRVGDVPTGPLVQVLGGCVQSGTSSLGAVDAGSLADGTTPGGQAHTLWSHR
jgi:hypothetical protein